MAKTTSGKMFLSGDLTTVQMTRADYDGMVKRLSDLEALIMGAEQFVIAIEKTAPMIKSENAQKAAKNWLDRKRRILP